MGPIIIKEMTILEFKEILKEHQNSPNPILFRLDNGIIIETKGAFNSADRKKHKLIKEQHPELDIRFMFEKKWHDKWPISPDTERKIPTLIRFEFKKSGKDYLWIIEPNIDYEYKR